MREKIRGILVHPEELTEKWLRKMAAAGLNTLGLHPVGGENADESLQRAIDRHTLPEFRRLLALASELGIQVEYEAHTMRWLLPKHLFSLHPGWFRMNEAGERTDDCNLCPSCSEALAYIAERTALLASLLETGSSSYHFWLDDVSAGKCCCEKCRGLSDSDQQLIVVNAMLRGLKRYKKDAKLCYLAYYKTVAVPEQVKPEKGVFLEYAPYQRDFHAPLDDSENAKNASEIAPLPALLSYFGTENARVLEYWTDNSLYSLYTKPPREFHLDEAVMQQDTAFYRRMGFEDITAFGCYLGPDYEALYGDVDLKVYGEILKS